jgi:spectinomycin phosphotransferase
MLERPDIADSTLMTQLSRAYGTAVVQLDFLPVGNDATSWAFRVLDAAGTHWFLKLRRGALAAAGLMVPRLLNDAGLTAVVAPVPAQTGALATPIPASDYALVLYPFVQGVTGMDAGLTPAQWHALGAILRRVHDHAGTAPLPADLPREAFQPAWRDMVLRVDAHLATVDPATCDELTRAFAAAWTVRRDEIHALVARCDELGAHLRHQDNPHALCHADIHTANVLVDPAGDLHLVDWDGALLAPRERDLLFFVGNEVQPARMSADTRAFLAGYGPVQIDPAALAYYCYEWVVQELGDYGARMLFMPELGHASRRQALDEFNQLFAPGDVVDGAYAVEAHL